MANGIAAVGPTFPTAFSFKSGLGANRLFVPGGVRDMAWNAGCRCMQYRGATVTPL
jgi:hypothetical protein